MLAVAAVLTAAPPSASADDQTPGGSFTDDDRNVHEGFIEAIAEEGITRGCAGDRFCPTRAVTRGEMAAFIVRALGLPPAATTDRFVDDDGHTFERDIDALGEAGITRGCGDGTTFCPDDAVTRGELAAFLRRAGGLPAGEPDRFTDDDDSVFEADIDALAAAGITAGCNPPENTRFCPDEPTRRDQMATFLARLLDLHAHPPPPRDLGTLSVEESLRTWFPDIYAEATAVVRCESSFDPTAVNPRGQGFHGLFQISAEFHRPAFERVTGRAWEDAIYTAYYNSQYARYLYDQTDSWRAWSCKP